MPSKRVTNRLKKFPLVHTHALFSAVQRLREDYDLGLLLICTEPFDDIREDVRKTQVLPLANNMAKLDKNEFTQALSILHDSYKPRLSRDPRYDMPTRALEYMVLHG